MTMQSKYKQTVLTGLLCNPLVSPAIKERILHVAGNSWDWLAAIVKSPLEKQCIPAVAVGAPHQIS